MLASFSKDNWILMFNSSSLFNKTQFKLKMILSCLNWIFQSDLLSAFRSFQNQNIYLFFVKSFSLLLTFSSPSKRNILKINSTHNRMRINFHKLRCKRSLWNIVKYFFVDRIKWMTFVKGRTRHSHHVAFTSFCFSQSDINHEKRYVIYNFSDSTVIIYYEAAKIQFIVNIQSKFKLRNERQNYAPAVRI